MLWRLARLRQKAPLTAEHSPSCANIAELLAQFHILKCNDETKFNGDYRTKRTILEIYDGLAESTRTRQSYQERERFRESL